jgi:polyferredoxin/ferredoxin
VLFLVLFFFVLRPDITAPGGAEPLAQPEGSEFFLMIDPLVSLSTAIASKTVVWALIAAGIMLAVSLVLPRCFCGYVCPMGTLLDVFDWSIGKRVTRFQLGRRGWWVYLKYYILAGITVAALFGVLLSGFFAAIPVLTRGMAFLLGPLQIGVMEGLRNVPPMDVGHVLSIGLFLLVLGLGFLRPRFWCRYVCPTGAIFSIGNLLRLTNRHVKASCNGCGLCKRNCPFDAAKDDFTSRGTECTFCQTCGGLCPKHAIEFAPRWSRFDLKPAYDPPVHEVALSRRGFLIGTAASGVVVVGTRTVLGARLGREGAFLPIRPPCSVPEEQFLQMCIRCQACTKACPSELLQPLRFQQGLDGLWTPYANTDWAGCDPNCNRCSEACPTGAIREVPLEEKQAARMGRAIVDEGTCLPHAGRQECQLCYDACKHAGHEAIDLVRVRPELEPDGTPVEGTGYLAPSVAADKCVGCGLCQSRCGSVNVREKGLLAATPIRVEAGSGKDDRLMTGSYVAVREQERQARKAKRAATSVFEIPPIDAGNSAEAAPSSQPVGEDLPDFMK